MSRRTNLLALLAAGAVTVLVVAGLSNAASSSKPTLQTEPKISGTAVEGNTLSANSGSWNGSNPITYKYQWRRCDAKGNGCANIGGADSSSYLVRHADIGNTIRVRVTATNSDGSTSANSNQTDVVKAKTAPPPTSVNGCPTGTGALDVSGITSPAHLVIDGQTASPSVVTRSTQDLTLRFHVSACGGRSVQNALVLAEAIPFSQFNVPAEVPTDATGWATVTMHQDRFFPASPRQQILAVFVRARKSGEPLLAGIAARRLVSFPVHA
ncbi:MAG TPA: hypothetical protein VFW85_10530 [Gaiellaceae bacterium]|nr:hypothetical protein [Gaiellaceae bacterium]